MKYWLRLALTLVMTSVAVVTTAQLVQGSDYAPKAGDFAIECTLFDGNPPEAKGVDWEVHLHYNSPYYFFVARLEKILMGVSPWPIHSTVRFFIHSPSQVFQGTKFSGKRYKLIFTPEIIGKTRGVEYHLSALTKMDDGPPPQKAAAECFREAPILIHQVLPDYPLSALKMNIGGSVKLELAVDVDGTVIDSRIDHGEHPMLNETAMTVVRQWRYAPTKGLDKDYRFVVVVVMSFVLKDHSVLAEMEPQAIAPTIEESEDRPVLIKQVQPVFSKEQRMSAGMIIAKLQIHPSGRVVKACIVRSEDPALEEPFLAALLQWRYEMPEKLKKSNFPIFKVVVLHIDVH